MFHFVPGVPLVKMERFAGGIHKLALHLTAVGEEFDDVTVCLYRTQVKLWEVILNAP